MVGEVNMAWNYEESVMQVKAMVQKWSNSTIELVEKLYTARLELHHIGGDRRSINVQNGTLKTWTSRLARASEK